MAPNFTLVSFLLLPLGPSAPKGVHPAQVSGPNDVYPEHTSAWVCSRQTHLCAYYCHTFSENLTFEGEKDCFQKFPYDSCGHQIFLGDRIPLIKTYKLYWPS